MNLANPACQVPFWYVPPELQLKQFSKLNVEYEWGFTELDSLARIPDFEKKTPTEVLMLAAYFDRNGEISAVQRTFDVWYNFVVPPAGYSKRRWSKVKSDPNHLRLLPIIEHRPGVRWVVFDPNANSNESPVSCWEKPDIAINLAHAEVLMAATLFPKWASSCDGSQWLYPNLAGYQFKWENGDWTGLMCPDEWQDLRCSKLYTYWLNESREEWSSPSVRDT